MSQGIESKAKVNGMLDKQVLHSPSSSIRLFRLMRFLDHKMAAPSIS